jgi:hypothetical protein
MHEKVEDLLKQPWTIPTVIGVLSFGGGLGLGFWLGKRQRAVEFVEESYEESSLRFDVPDVAVETITRPPKVVIPAEVVEQKVTTVKDLSDLRPSMVTDEDEPDEDPKEIPEEDDEPDIIVPDITDEIEWDYDKEIKSRSSQEPYVLHQEEFYADELDYTQTTLTYYAIDDIMADEDEKPVYNYKNVTGELNFGHGSGDPDTVYIRNDQRRAEYEVIRLDALYSREVLGLEIENNQRVADLKHSKISRFRME